MLRTLKDSVGMLKVTVVEAADLLASDPNGKSDPFCVVKLGENQEQRTDVIPASLNPRWNHSVSGKSPTMLCGKRLPLLLHLVSFRWNLPYMILTRMFWR